MSREFPLNGVKFDAEGLVPVIAQEETTGEILMLAWANREAIERSLKTRRMTYYSRSRKALWRKGETSGNAQELVRLHLDCDGDAVLALVRMEGPACHEGTDTCFARVDEDVPRPVLADLAATIRARRMRAPEKSYTARLLKDANLASKKIGEEAAELVVALAREPEERVAEEAADLVYHLLAACAARNVDLNAILSRLAARRK